MPDTTIHERRQLNLEIEQAFIDAAETCTAIHVMLHVKRGGSVLSLYERFYSAFDLLYTLTCYQKQLSAHKDLVNGVDKWLMKDINSENDTDIKERCREGDEMFRKYAKLLYDQGMIALPLK